MELTAFERRLAGEWAEAFIPAFDGMESGGASLDPEFWSRFSSSAPLLMKFGFRLAVVVATMARFGRERGACLRRWSHSRLYLVRQLVLVMRVVFSLAHFSRHDVRERLT